MSTKGRFHSGLDVVDVVPNSLLTAFAGEAERERMARLRSKIEVVRRAWIENDKYGELIDTVRACCKPHTLPKEVRQPLERLLRGFHDYADVKADRPVRAMAEQFDALELYCSVEGHEYLWKLVGQTLRRDDATEELLLTATTLVEFLTIDLYNLRLSQLGDPRYANFEGVTHRGLSARRAAVAEYDAILARPNLAHRGFAIPLGLASTSADVAVMHQFAASPPPPSSGGGAVADNDDDTVSMHLEVHVCGIEPALLAVYRARYPDSAVSSICAMPVGRVSPLREKEVLLRGAFFQLLAVRRDEDTYPPVRLVVLTMNANRDHTTELSSDLQDKKTQRDMFRRVVEVSKYRACASLAAELSAVDAKGYAVLAEERMRDLRQLHGLPEQNVLPRPVGRGTAALDIAVWMGGALTSCYPRHFVSQRQRWQHALNKRDWVELNDILDEEYEWRRWDWYNVCALVEDSGLGHIEKPSDSSGLTLLHVLAGSDPPARKDLIQREAWSNLVDGISNSGVWSTFGDAHESTG